MRSYQNYKSTGVQWLGSVPTHWKKIRFKDILKVKDSRVGKRKDLTLLSLTKKGVIVRDLSDGKGKFPKDYEAYKIVHPNDFILCLFDVDETPRTVGIAKHEGMITGAYDVFDIVGANREYIYYLYLSFDDAKSLKPLYKGLRKTIPLPSLRSSYLFLPTIDEQVAITDYIKSEVNKIDHLISETEKEISLLNELKQAEIARMVTSGLNPNVQMKNSGITWIGDIPAHWEVRRIKWLFKENDTRNVNLSYQLLSFSRSKGIIPYSDINDKAPSASDLSKYKIIRPGQLLENRMQAWSGMFGSSKIEGCVSPDYAVFDRTNENVNVDYYGYLFRTPLYVQQFANASKGVGDGFNRLYTPAFGAIYAIFPPSDEQTAIVSAIEAAKVKIDAMTSQLTRQITYLQELKQRIISDAVTGKIDVRDYNN